MTATAFILKLPQEQSKASVSQFYGTFLCLYPILIMGTVFILNTGAHYLLTMLVINVNKSILLPVNVCKTAGCVANSEDPDQTPHSAASDLGLHCLLLLSDLKFGAITVSSAVSDLGLLCLFLFVCPST